MKAKQVLAVTALWFTGAAGIANAFQPTVSVNNAGSFSEHAVTVRPGDTFSIDVTVDTIEEIFDMYDLKLVAGSLGVFTVTGGSAHVPWVDGGTVPIGELSPESASFAVELPDPDLFGPGETALLTLDIAVSSDVSPGMGTLNVIDGKWTACRICPAFGDASSGPDFTVEVLAGPPIPTVSHWGLIVMGLLVLAVGTIGVRRRRLCVTCA